MTDPRRKMSALMGRMRKTSERGEASHGSEPVADLDEEMEKVFAMAEDEKFTMAKLVASPSDSNTSKKSFGEEDYSSEGSDNAHRKKSYPHIHMPLKALHSRARKRSQKELDADSVDAESGPSKLSMPATDSDAGLSPLVVTDQPSTSYSGALLERGDGDSEEVEAEVSERAASSYDSTMFASPSSDALRRVQFQIGDISEVSELQTADTTPEGDGSKEVDSSKDEKPRRKSSRHHHHHHKSRKYSLQEDPQSRMRSGSEFDGDSDRGRRVSIQPEDASLMQEQDIDDLNSHRCDPGRGSRRFKSQQKGSGASVIHIGRKDGYEGLQHLKKMFDHTPHEVFVQLDELSGDGDEREWKETARWIKYEEDVEEGADRWGRPHVASLSFHSLLNLRRCLETGVVLLDLEEKDLPGVAYRVVEQMVVDELILPEDKTTVMRALLLRHRHVNEHERFRFGMKRTFSSYTSLQNLNDDKSKPKIVPSVISMDNSTPSVKLVGRGDGDNHTIDMKEEMTYTSSSEDLKRAQKESILKRIPQGAEATTVLVGAVDFLEQPTIAFIRLAEGILMPSITEVTMPVRFMFILLGPKITDLDYHEIGRSISTLMSNIQFHKIAYKADERKDLLSAINEFLDDSIVLPPGDWEKKALLPFEELKAKSDMIKRRKDKRAKAAVDPATKALIADGDGKPPPDDDDPLKRTRRPFGGLVKDIKRRLPYYISDFVDGCNPQCLAASIFMYFAALSGAVTFGGLMGDKTDNLIGISETLLSTAIAGIVFALFSGQPLIIVGATGPLLLFDESLVSFCLTNEVDFLAVRVYIGLWLGIIALVVVCFEGSVLVKLFTRFTEEIFASLISLLYIIESFMKLINVFGRHPMLSLDEYCEENGTAIISHFASLSNITVDENSTAIGIVNDSVSTTIKPVYQAPLNQPNTALFCTILALGTFFIAYYLRQFRNSKFLGRSVRRALGDFGVPIAIISMVLLDYLNPNTYTEKLKVPEGLSPSNAAVRGWIISPANIEQVWIMFAALAPALLVYILLFMETHICELIIAKPDRKLKKGSGFHLDIVLVCLLNVGCGFMGAPWVCAATVRSIAHVSAVTVMSRTHAPGDKPHVIEVKEQRMSALLVATMVGLSVLMAPLLRLIPISVLFGVFLYMGVSSTNGIQFFERLQLFFMPVKHHPQVPYVRRVQSMKMHLFTAIQLACLAILWVVKSTQASLAFPFFLILMVPLRAQLRFIFTVSELRALDSSDANEENQEDGEPDFYTEAPLPG